MVPPILLFLTSSTLAKKHHLDHVKFVFSGAAPLSDTDFERFIEKFRTSIKCCQGYGLTESSPAAFIEMSGKKYASIGKPVSNCQARLVDIETKKDICEPHKSGELLISGPHIMKGYFENAEATKETLENGWLKTGDVAYFDEDGDFFISDRIKELIKVKGFQVRCNCICAAIFRGNVYFSANPWKMKIHILWFRWLQLNWRVFCEHILASQKLQ